MTAMSDRLKRRWKAIDERRKPVVQYLLFAAVLALMIFALYIRYILGSRTFIFAEAGADSWAQSVPFFLNAAERFGKLDFSTWNFSQFLGAQTVQAANPEYLASALGRDFVEPMMIIAQMAKVFLAGTLFYLFTFYWNLRYATRFVSSLGVAFCGRIVALSAWTGYTMEVTLAVALIWAFERFLANPGKFIALPVSFALMVATLGVYGTVLYSFVMLVYVVFRVGYGSHRLESAHKVAAFAGQLLLLYVAGILLAAVTLLPIAEGYLDSARVASNSEGVHFPQTVTIGVYAAEVLSLFSPAALGTMDNYSGPCNTLNNPYFYCGTILLLGVPFAFQGKNRRQKTWMGLFAGIALAYVLSPSLRYILNGFGVGPYDFRMSSFWITIVIAVLGMLGVEELLKRAKPRRLICVMAGLALLLGWSCLVLRDDVWVRWVALSAICLVAYAALFAKAGDTVVRSGALVALCAFELLAQGYSLVTDVPAVTKSDYSYEYNDEFATLIDDVDGNDDDLYRIDWKTPLLTRSMAYGYRGTQVYIGGTGVSKAQTRFMASTCANDYIAELGYSRYAYGFYDNGLNTLLGVRYLVYDVRNHDRHSTYYAPFGYSEVETANDDYLIYENGNALPFIVSYAYDEAIGEEQHLGLDRASRGSAMFARCVVPDGLVHASSLDEATYRGESAETLAASDKTLTGGDEVKLAFTAGDAPYLILEAQLNAQAVEGGVNVPLTITLENEETGAVLTIPYLTAIGNEAISVSVPNDGYTNATFSLSRYTNQDIPIRVSHCTVEAAPRSYYDWYTAVCEDKLAENPAVTEASSDRVAGSLDVADDGYIVTSVPWSESWHAYVDGAEIETFPVNYGFVGMEARAGHHVVELVYRDVPREIGAWLSLIALIALVALRGATAASSRRRAPERRETRG